MSNFSISSLTPEQVLKTIPKTLIVGYGNPDREDDGVAWHILLGIARKFNILTPTQIYDGLFPEDRSLDFWLNLQLTPEMAEDMTSYRRICFVDAHTGAVPNDINWQPVISQFQNSPLTHHLTPSSLISLLEHAYHHKPEAILVSVRGYSFRFKPELSQDTEKLSSLAVDRIIDWVLSPIL
jgi:hydrogenase maturation protease